MLTIYRRHVVPDPKTGNGGCEHRHKGRAWKRCQCPIWTAGTLNGKKFPKTSLAKLGVVTLEQAQARIQEWEAAGRMTSKREHSMSMPDAVDRFLTDAKARRLAGPTLENYFYFTKQIKDFAKRHGIRDVSQMDLAATEALRNEWNEKSAGTARSRLAQLRMFIGFCVKRKWVDHNHAWDLKLPKEDRTPTLPYTLEEMQKILATLDKRIANTTNKWWRTRMIRLRTLCLVMRYSGLRIGDAIKLSADHVMGTDLFLYSQKTGTPVFGSIPEFVAQALDQCPRARPNYYFWDGTDRIVTPIGSYRAALQRYVSPDCTPHRFRDTFAVESLNAGIPIERVSMLLGHTTILTTQKHYLPWVKSRQEAVKEDLQRIYRNDPLVAGESAKQMNIKLKRVK